MSATPSTINPRGDRKDHLDGLAVALLLGCCAVWGLGQVAAKLTLSRLA
jgi:hypothetical protein